MIRITALNSSDVSENDEIQVAEEAQETLVESEYMRALKLITMGFKNVALGLFKQLLNADILNEASTNKEYKLSLIRYNCHKHIAFLSEENKDCESAFQHFLAAIKIDDTDVHTLYKFGQFALKQQNLELAEYALNKCLLRNPKHFGAIDAMLDLYIKSNNILALYGLIVQLIRKKYYTKKAFQILNEMLVKFKSFIPFCEEIFGKLPNSICSDLEFVDENIFGFEYKELMCIESCKPKELPLLTQNQLSYFDLGEYILSTISLLKQENHNLMFTVSLEEIWNPFDKKETSLLENMSLNLEKSCSDDRIDKQKDQPNAIYCKQIEIEDNQAILNDTKIESNIDLQHLKTDEEIGKTKARRRCSDLHLLEQWGWHKTRKTSRKKMQQERLVEDNTPSGFLKRAFSKYLNLTFDELWPFSETDLEEDYQMMPADCQFCLDKIKASNFQQDTMNELNMFIEMLKTKRFDFILLSYKWLKEFSNFWNKFIPNELKVLYTNLYLVYISFFDYKNWVQLKPSSLKTFFDISLLYMELEYYNSTQDFRELSNQWTDTFNCLNFVYGAVAVEFRSNVLVWSLRILNLQYLQYELRNEISQCLRILDIMEQFILKNSLTFSIHLPNLNSHCISLRGIGRKRIELRKLINLAKIPNLFKERKWSQLTLLIKFYIHNTDNLHKCENWLKDFINLNELLLNCLWNQADFEECLLCSEKFLHYSTYYYLQENKLIWENSINYTLTYIESVIKLEGNSIVIALKEYLPRLIQNLVQILTNQLDSDSEKNVVFLGESGLIRIWVILHLILEREENICQDIGKSSDAEEANVDSFLPMSFMLLFKAHEHLGKRQACTIDRGQFLHYIFRTIVPNLRAPIYDSCRNNVFEYIEQVTHCMFGFPLRKGRSRHLEDHSSTLVELTWDISIELFDLYAPETLPEFNSYKVESISADMEQFLLRILSLLPKELEQTLAIKNVKNFISGVHSNILNEFENMNLPFKIKNIYYLLADYYFKSRDFNKAIKYYTFDLAGNPSRLDSWAGISLAKASIIETRLNSLNLIDIIQFLMECEEVIRCFDRCISLNQNHVLIWIEYGSFAYSLGSFCSRNIKKLLQRNGSQRGSLLKEKLERMFNISYNCFSLAANLQNADFTNIDSFEEKWLCQYMLGKISEKLKQKPNICLNHYLTASNYLYECNATYPIKINHSNPTTLSVEALELFYRINSTILKFIQNGLTVSRENGLLFKSVLKKLSRSPFAFNKAKINGSCIYALKRKNGENTEIAPNKKVVNKDFNGEFSSNLMDLNFDESLTKFVTQNINIKEREEMQQKNLVDLCKVSQDDTVTGASNITSATSTSSLSNFESESDSSSLENVNIIQPAICTSSELESIYSEAIKNLEECVIRFPEHYKTIYRLVYFYMNGPTKSKDLLKCEKLLLDQYKTGLGNIIDGLFYDRKTNNIFNGVWRIPSSEIDRPGSFSTHLVKCVEILIELLREQKNYKLLIDIVLQLYKTPDSDKRYIMDEERIELSETGVIYCEEIMRNILDRNRINRDDSEILNLLIDIYKIQKKCYKYTMQKDTWFSKIFVDVYKYYIENKIQNLPSNINYSDYAVKLCLQEINQRKCLEKNGNTGLSNLTDNLSAIEEKNDAYVPYYPLINRFRLHTESRELSSTNEERTGLEAINRILDTLANKPQHCAQKPESETLMDE